LNCSSVLELKVWLFIISWLATDPSLKTTNPSEVLYNGELSCTLRVIEDIRDIIGQCLGQHNTSPSEKNIQCTLPEARSVVGRETSIITHCLFDAANLLDSAFARHFRKKQL
jgi:hypothetical protein